MKQTLTVLALTFVAISSFASNDANVKSEKQTWCTVQRVLADEVRSYESGWMNTKEEAINKAMAACEADAVVYPATCDLGNCSTR